MRSVFVGAAVVLACGRVSPHAEPVPSYPATIPDRPVATSGDEEARRLYALLEPCRLRTQASYPKARARFLAGLDSGYFFAVTTRLVDADAREEQVFVLVDSIRGDVVFGKLASDIHLVRGYRHWQSLRVAESAILDWTIVRPDGSEEGNLMGQVIDAIRDNKPDPGKACAAQR